MHFMQQRLSRRDAGVSAVQDHEGVRAELLDLRPLIKRQRVLDRQRMQPETDAQLLDLHVGRSLEVKPEEPAVAQMLR